MHLPASLHPPFASDAPQTAHSKLSSVMGARWLVTMDGVLFEYTRPLLTRGWSLVVSL
jgi:hypothetical protein